jgi:hypothetical protein
MGVAAGSIKKSYLVAIAGGALTTGLLLLGFYLYAGSYGFNVLLRRGGSIWVAVTPDDSRLSPSMRMALRDPAPVAKAGPFQWEEIAFGFDVAELPIIAEGIEVDRILLARIDPARYKFSVRIVPAGNKELGDWMAEPNTVFAINGSYFTRYGHPDTPIVSAGILKGPQTYDAKHGAFVASNTFVGIRDLQAEDWRRAISGANDAMVSYPLLLAGDGSTRVSANRQWLANRSFVGQDKSGKVILGTTAEAFFSLERFADFLRASPLGLALALNLDGGPLACQGIAINKYRRDFCGDWETMSENGQVKLLQRAIGSRRWALPIVLVASPIR